MSAITNKGFKRSRGMEAMCTWIDYLEHRLPPGPAFIPKRLCVNLYTGSLPFYLFGLMVYYDNWSMGAWLYLALHGSYGWFCIIKDFVFPDSSLDRPITLTSFVFLWTHFGPYMLIGFCMMSRLGTAEMQTPSNERMFVSLVLYIFGLMLMMLTDVSKHLILRERDGLVTYGM